MAEKRKTSTTSAPAPRRAKQESKAAVLAAFAGARAGAGAGPRRGQREIVIDSNTHVTGKTITEIGRLNPDLEVLDCTDAASIERVAFIALSIGFEKLRTLRFGVEMWGLTQFRGGNISEIEMKCVL